MNQAFNRILVLKTYRYKYSLFSIPVECLEGYNTRRSLSLLLPKALNCGFNLLGSDPPWEGNAIVFSFEVLTYAAAKA